MNISLRQLRSVIAIAKHGRITVAADTLGLTPSAVTLQLQQLEQELDTQLFFRKRTGAEATDTGTIVIDAARRIMTELEVLQEKLDAHEGLERGMVRMGVVSTGKYFAPRLISAFNKLHPGIELRLMTANRADIIRMLADHDIDLALMGRPPKELSVRSTLVGDHPLVFIAHPGHPLAGRRDIPKIELVSQRFIVRERGSGTRSSFEIFLSDLTDDQMPQTAEMDSNETIKQAVMAGLGLAFISGHTIEQELKAGTLTVLDVHDTPIRRQWFSVRNADRMATPSMLALDDFLRTEGLSHMPIIPKTYPARD